MDPLVSNFRVQSLTDCTFERCERFTIGVDWVSLSVPTSFDPKSNLHATNKNRLDDFQKYRGYAQQILGDKYERHKQAFEKARSHKNTNFVPHRLIYLDERIEASLRGMHEVPPNVDFMALSEIGFFKFLFEKFRTNRAWSEIRSELRSQGSFVHHLISFIFLYTNRLRGTEVDFVASSNATKRECDLVLFTPLKDRVNVEVKAPELLWAPRALTQEQAEKLIEKCWKRSKGQRGKRTSVIVIGGIYIPDASMTHLRDAAERYLNARKNNTVLMIQIMSYSLLVERPKSLTPLTFGPDTSMTPQVKLQFAQNTYYKGIVRLLARDRVVRGMSVSPENTIEVTTGPLVKAP